MPTAKIRSIFILACFIAMRPLSAEVLRGESACGSLSSATSGTDSEPSDFRNPPQNKLKTVEKFHFTSNVENLTRGESAALGADIGFTLRYFPNHPRALAAMVKLAQKEKTDQPLGSIYRVDCWFDRAVRFAPDDAQVNILYGFWLLKKGERGLAKEHFEKASKAENTTGNVNYNLGLAYFEIGEYDKALEYAHKADSAGFRLPGLKRKLESKKQWKDPPPPPENTSESVNHDTIK